MSYTPFKMKGPSLYRNNSATPKVGDKPKDINKNGQIEEWEQARFDAIKANSPTNYGSPVKVEKYKDKITAKKEKEKAAFEEKKKAAIRQGKIANWNKKNPKATQEEMNKFISSLD